MVVFDTNVFINVAKERLGLVVIDDVKACYASITVIETLGFHEITAAEQRKLLQILDAYELIDLTAPIIQRAVSLRQDKKMSLGDAIIAATALELNYPLWTTNTDDFKHIEGLSIFNPLTATP